MNFYLIKILVNKIYKIILFIFYSYILEPNIDDKY